ncbi:MAG: YdeI/OmpD-associated family protein, partial [Sphingobacterium sp.]
IYSFRAAVEIIGINPFVSIPVEILEAIFKLATKNKGPIPVTGTINKKIYQQTLLKYKGQWRLYINTTMLKDSPKRIGELIEITITYDPADRTIKPHPQFSIALENNVEAKQSFNALTPSMQKEMIRYIANLKTEQTRIRIITRAIDYLLGKSTFIGKRMLNDKT